MSYRSIKTVLGETSLERKCRFLFGASLLLLITASFWWYGWQMEKVVYRENSKTGRLLVDQAMFTKHWREVELNKQYQVLIDSLTTNLGKQKYKLDIIRPKAAAGSPWAPQDDFEWAVRIASSVKSRPPTHWNRTSGSSPEAKSINTISQFCAERRACLLACHGGPDGTVGGSSLTGQLPSSGAAIGRG